MLSVALLFSLIPSIHLNMDAMEPHELKEVQHSESGANSVQDLLPLCPTFKTNPSSTDHLSNMQQHPVECLSLAANPEWRFFSNPQFHVPLHVFSPNTTSSVVSIGASTLDEARDNRVSIVNEKRLKRVISNRESARRSRMRKKKLIEELQLQVNQVQTINHQLSEKLIRLLESNHQILQENAQLKDKVSSLQIVISDMLTPPKGLEEVTDTANMNRFRSEASTLLIHR